MGIQSTCHTLGHNDGYEEEEETEQLIDRQRHCQAEESEPPVDTANDF